MASQLRPTRLAVTDRFPMLGFTIKTDSAPRVAEIVIATDPALFTKREGRSPSTFYNSREHGPLSVPRNEAVYVVPPEVLSRFVAADRLWFGLATASAPAASDWTVDALPTAPAPMSRCPVSATARCAASGSIRRAPAPGPMAVKGPHPCSSGPATAPSRA